MNSLWAESSALDLGNRVHDALNKIGKGQAKLEDYIEENEVKSIKNGLEALEKIKNDVVKFLLNLNIVVSNENEREKKSKEISSDNKKVGRNEKCPCGSGKKYKHCCGSV